MKKLMSIKSKVVLAIIAAGLVILQSCVVYRPYSDNSNLLTVPEIIKMSKEGVSSMNIINEIKKSHTAYGLKADQLANLREEGVQDSVINYMEQTRIDLIQSDQRYADSSYWWPADGFFYGAFGWGWPGMYFGLNLRPALMYGINRGYYGGYHFSGGYHGRGGFHGGFRR